MRTSALLGTPFGKAVIGARIAAPPVGVSPGEGDGPAGAFFFTSGVDDCVMGAGTLAWLFPRSPPPAVARRAPIRRLAWPSQGRKSMGNGRRMPSIQDVDIYAELRGLAAFA